MKKLFNSSLVILLFSLFSCASVPIPQVQDQNIPERIENSIVYVQVTLTVEIDKSKMESDDMSKKSFMKISTPVALGENIKKVSGSGSGAAIFVKNQKINTTTILTAEHVCSMEKGFPSFVTVLKKEVTITNINGEKYPGIIVKKDSENDLCLVEIPVTMQTVEIASKEPKRGEKAFTMGYPGGIYLKNLVNKYVGYCSGIVSGMSYNSYTNESIQKTIFSIYSFPGSSGSSIFNSSGQVIGIVQAGSTRILFFTISSTVSTIKEFIEK